MLTKLREFTFRTSLCCSIPAQFFSLVLPFVVFVKFGDGFWELQTIVTAQQKQNQVSDSLLKSWKTEPFVDVIVLDSNKHQVCPKTHPEEIMYDIWPGTTHYCDCLQRSSNRLYELNKKCIKTGKHPKHSAVECVNVEAIPPVVQKSINGAILCGKRAVDFSMFSMSLKKSRPIWLSQLKEVDDYCP